MKCLGQLQPPPYGNAGGGQVPKNIFIGIA